MRMILPARFVPLVERYPLQKPVAPLLKTFMKPLQSLSEVKSVKGEIRTNTKKNLKCS